MADALAIAKTRPRAALPFGNWDIDERLGGGLALGGWHEIGGEGLEGEIAAASGAFAAALAAGVVARAAASGAMVAWIGRRDDLHGPGLAQLGLPVERLIFVKAPDEVGVVATMEAAARAGGIAAVIGEAAAIDLVAGRRLQLACETGGATAFLIRRRPFGGPVLNKTALALGGAAATRWTISPAPSESETAEPGLGAPRWRVVLERCRGGRPGAWIMEKSDAALPLRVVARLGDRQLETSPSLRLAG